MNKKIILYILVTVTAMLGFLTVDLNADSRAEEKALFEKAKLKLFDREWSSALTHLSAYVKAHPDGVYYQKALFYRGKCYEELKQWGRALDSYRLYSKNADNRNLFEEAAIAIIDISYKLAEKKKRGNLDRIVHYLKNDAKTIRYYAAFKLSYLKDKTTAEKGVSVLRYIVESEEDRELIDRAKLALMRIDPKYLKSTKKSTDPSGKDICIRIYDKKRKVETLSLNIPFLLAKMAFEAIPEKEKKAIEKEGYSYDGIIKQLIKTGDLLKFEVEDLVFKIWIK